MSRKPKTLTDADRRLWNRVTRTVAPKDAPAHLRGDLADEFARLMRRPPPERSTPRTPGPLEPTFAKTVRRGRVTIEARIDLHDLTLAEAYPVLERGLIRAYNRGKSCVLVITGKGFEPRSGRYSGKLRAALPGWLAGADLRPIVATYAPAHPRHGGAGAWYVFLKSAD